MKNTNKIIKELNKQLDNYLSARSEILREITVFGQSKANEIQLEIVNDKILEVIRMIKNNENK
tara:strand:- start:848 stop:1036 length:189 start_codon:yes stop_codon:yes gene_type:complete